MTLPELRRHSWWMRKWRSILSISHGKNPKTILVSSCIPLDQLVTPPISFKFSLSHFSGLPKPIRFTSYMMSLVDRGEAWPLLRNQKVLIAMPLSWVVGLDFQMQIALDIGIIPILLPPDAPWPLPASYIDEIHTITKPQPGAYVPAVLGELTRNPTYIDNMRHMELIAFGGAPLNKGVGDLLWTFTFGLY